MAFISVSSGVCPPAARDCSDAIAQKAMQKTMKVRMLEKLRFIMAAQ
jgi:hypothetical protein